MSKSTQTIDMQDVQVMDSEGSYSVPTSNSEVTQKEMAEICKVSITTVKSYLKQVQKLFPRETLKNSTNRYFGWVLEEVKRYQDACGGYKVVEGELIQNIDKIDFDAYKSLRNITAEPVVEVIEPEDYEPSMAITLPKFDQSISAEKQSSIDVSRQDTFDIFRSLVSNAALLGVRTGDVMADAAIAAASIQMNKRLSTDFQRLTNEAVRATES